MQKWMEKICKKYSKRNMIYPYITYSDFDMLSREKKKEYKILNVKKHDSVILSEQNNVHLLAKIKALWELDAIPCLLPLSLSQQKKENITDVRNKKIPKE